jgi:signal transduction histidine kinase
MSFSRLRAAARPFAFLLTGLPLGIAWFVLLVTGWSLAIGLLIIPLGIPVVLALSWLCPGAARLERTLARALLGVELPVAVPSGPSGPWARLKWWLSSGAAWREQAYLMLRFVLGLPFGTVAIAVVGLGLQLVTAPTYYWASDIDFGVWTVDTLGEAVLLVPVGVALLAISPFVVSILARPWRPIARGLLQGSAAAPAAAPAAVSPRVDPVAGPRRASRALKIHAVVEASLSGALVVIWAGAGPHDYFWPWWPMLALGLILGVHAVFAYTRAVAPRRRRLLEVHAGLTLVLALYLIGTWVGAGPYDVFWPMWPIIAIALPLGVHFAAVRFSSEDRAELSERIDVLTETRAGAVDAQAAELRRIERDLHDGAQARLVALAMELGMAEDKLETEPEEARRLVAEARRDARQALVELRDLARGISPPVLADRGLQAAVEALAARSPVPVALSADTARRPGLAVESAAYFVVAEALTNAAKHSGASRVDVRIAAPPGALTVEVSDDGVGGADPAGQGLDGLRRRVEALDGTLEVESPPGGPTLLRASLPCAW